MKLNLRQRWLAFLCLAVAISTNDPKASSLLPLTMVEHVLESQAVLRGTVLQNHAYIDMDGLIYTRTEIQVDEALKGKFPGRIRVVHRGGRVGNEDSYFGLSPRLKPGEQYLLFLRRGANGRLVCTQGHGSAMNLKGQGGAGLGLFQMPGRAFLESARGICALDASAMAEDFGDQASSAGPLPAATSGMLGGENARFLQPDRGEPIPVLLDADKLPSGMTLAQATNAVAQALNAWTAVTSLKFQIQGIISLGRGADTLTIADETLRIQLHDNYNRINSAGTLGIGGRNARSQPTPAGWDLGGNVAGNEFKKTVFGYVILESGKKEMENPATFAEVLCHEIGHALNMAHSSESPTEDPLMLNSVMYYLSHADGRGAVLGAYDPPIIRQCYPANTVPYTFDRVMDVVTAPAAIHAPGINQIELRGYDLQSKTLGLELDGETASNGAFAVNGTRLAYTPNAFYSDSTRIDPDTSGGTYSYRELAFVRFSDGVNASPYGLVRVLSYRGEATNSPDGIPDYWMTKYFGNANPSAGNQSRAADDPDGDGLNNLQEFLLGTHPKDPNSRLRIPSFDGTTLQFEGQAYELYEVLGSTDLVNWSLVRAVTPSSSSAAFRTSLPQTNLIASVTNLPHWGQQMFYRVVKVP